MRVASFVALAAVAVAGCSVINSFEDVKTEPTSTGTGGSSGSTGGKGGSATKGSGGEAGDASTEGSVGGGGNTGTGGGGGGGAGGRGGAGGGAGGGNAGADAGDGGFTPGGPNGALVAYNVATGNQKLYVLDPTNGHELSSEKMASIRGIVNDGETDHWFILELPGLDTEGITVHARDLNTTTGAWKELGKVTGQRIPISRLATFGTLSNAFLAYVSDSPTGEELIVLNTSNPADIKSVPGSPQKLPPGTKAGVIGNQSAVVVAIFQGAGCPTGDAGTPECPVTLARYLVNPSSGITPGRVDVVGKTSDVGNIDVVDDPGANTTIIGFPPVQPLTTGQVCNQTSRTTATVQSFGSVQFNPITQVSGILMEAPRFAGGAAYDSCKKVMFLTSVLGETAIWAVPVDASKTVKKICDGSAGGRMLFEPYTKTLFRSVPADRSMQSYGVDDSGGQPVLTNKTLQFPAGFQFGSIAVRYPRNPPNCL